MNINKYQELSKKLEKYKNALIEIELKGKGEIRGVTANKLSEIARKILID